MASQGHRDPPAARCSALCGRPDRVDRRQVDHVEAHGRDLLQPACGAAQGPPGRLAPPHRVGPHAFRAGEELIPRAVKRTLPVHGQRVAGRPGQQLAQRVGGEDGQDLVVIGGGEPVPGRDGRVPQPGGERQQRRAGGLRGLGGAGRVGPAGARRGGRRSRPSRPGRPYWPGGPGRHCAVGPDGSGRPLEQDRALGHHEADVKPARDLDAGVVAPVRDRVSPRLDLELPAAFAAHGDPSRITVGAGHGLSHADEGLPFAGGGAQDHSRAEHLMAFPEDGRADLEGLTGHRLGGAPPAFQDRLHIQDGYASDHL
jgi:hypothetical protein